MINYNEYIKKRETREKIASYLRYKNRLCVQQISFEVPNRLFRYSGINEYVIGNLENGSITLSNPILFNDLYDAALHQNSFESRCVDEINRRKVLQIFGVHEQEGISLENLRAETEHEDRFLSQYMKEGWKVGCLSEDNRSILMWSHYADKNQGLCIEYDLTGTALQPFMFPVIYVPTPVDCSDLCDTYRTTFDIDMAMLLSSIVKCQVWEYEQEWRMIYYFSAREHSEERERIQVAMPKPKAIYLGRAFLQYWLQNKKSKSFSLFCRLCEYVRNNNIELYVMKNKLMSYELYPEKINIDCVQRLDEDELYDKYLV